MPAVDGTVLLNWANLGDGATRRCSQDCPANSRRGCSIYNLRRGMVGVGFDRDLRGRTANGTSPVSSVGGAFFAASRHTARHDRHMIWLRRMSRSSAIDLPRPPAAGLLFALHPRWMINRPGRRARLFRTRPRLGGVQFRTADCRVLCFSCGAKESPSD
jgi:hypothetical protein